MLIWILILLFIWIHIKTQSDGFKGKKIGKSIKKGVTKTTKTISKAANQVGSSVAKIATSSLGSTARTVLKNMKVIKKAIASFVKKGDSYKSSAIPASVGLVARKCGMS